MIALFIVLGSLLGYGFFGYIAAILNISYAFKHSAYGERATQFLKDTDPDWYDIKYGEEAVYKYKREMRSQFALMFWLWPFVLIIRTIAGVSHFLHDFVEASIDKTIIKRDPVVKQVKIHELQQKYEETLAINARLEADLLEKNRIPDVLDELDHYPAKDYR